MSSIYEHFAEQYKDSIVDAIEDIHLTLCESMPIQDADLCWGYLVLHYYYDKPFGEA
tara:strand:+ start:984 stop:1154 length:171 start_codon:yes stop_codon:yes gene_type:complete